MRARVISLVSIIIILIIALIGCSTDQIVEEDYDLQEEESILTEIGSHTLKPEDEYSYSPDQRYVLLEKHIVDIEHDLYLIDTMTDAEQKIDVHGNFSLSWSPDSSVFIASGGTGYIRYVHIYSVDPLKEIYTVTTAGFTRWSPDSKKILIPIENKDIPVYGLSTDGTTDLAVYNIETDSLDVILKGTNEYILIPEDWDEYNWITYTKKYLYIPKEEGDTGRWTFKYKYRDAK